MKLRLCCLLLAVLLCVSACQINDSQPEEDIFYFYYPARTPSYTNNGSLVRQKVESEIANLTLEQVVAQYLESVPPATALSPCPSSWLLESAILQNSTATLVFTGKSASALERSLSATCLSYTLLQLAGVQRISLTTPESSEPLLLSENDISLRDTGMLPQEEILILYHPDANRRYLVREILTVEAMDAAEKPAYLMQQLLSARQRGQLTSCIPEGTELLSIHIDNGICTVDLSSEFHKDFEQSVSAERMAVYSIVNSLTELPEITTVDIWVAGAPLEQLCRMELSSGIVRDEGLIAVPVSNDLQDITLYLACEGCEQLISVPMMLQVDLEQQFAVSVMEKLLNYEEKNGIYGCIPKGTKILSLRMEGNTCIIDLTGEFIDGCISAVQEQLAVRSTVATLCALPEINSVEILVEGIAPVYRDASLSGLQTLDPDWISE